MKKHFELTTTTRKIVYVSVEKNHMTVTLPGTGIEDSEAWVDAEEGGLVVTRGVKRYLVPNLFWCELEMINDIYRCGSCYSRPVIFKGVELNKPLSKTEPNPENRRLAILCPETCDFAYLMENYQNRRFYAYEVDPSTGKDEISIVSKNGHTTLEWRTEIDGSPLTIAEILQHISGYGIGAGPIVHVVETRDGVHNDDAWENLFGAEREMENFYLRPHIMKVVCRTREPKEWQMFSIDEKAGAC